MEELFSGIGDAIGGFVEGLGSLIGGALGIPGVGGGGGASMPSAGVPQMFKDFTMNLPQPLQQPAIMGAQNSLQNLTKSLPGGEMQIPDQMVPQLGRQMGGMPSQMPPTVPQRVPQIPGGMRPPMQVNPMQRAPQMPMQQAPVLQRPQGLLSQLSNSIYPQANAMPLDRLATEARTRAFPERTPQIAAQGENPYSDMFQKVAEKQGINQNYLNDLAKIESRYNPRAVSSTGAQGLFQFTKGTWDNITSKYPDAFKDVKLDRMDPEANTIATGLLAKDNAAYLEDKLGRPPTSTEVYMAHNIGPANAVKLIQAKGSDSTRILPSSVTGPNPTFFRSGGVPTSVEDARRRYAAQVRNEAFR